MELMNYRTWRTKLSYLGNKNYIVPGGETIGSVGEFYRVWRGKLSGLWRKTIGSVGEKGISTFIVTIVKTK